MCFQGLWIGERRGKKGVGKGGKGREESKEKGRREERKGKTDWAITGLPFLFRRVNLKPENSFWAGNVVSTIWCYLVSCKANTELYNGLSYLVCKNYPAIGLPFYFIMLERHSSAYFSQALWEIRVSSKALKVKFIFATVGSRHPKC